MNFQKNIIAFILVLTVFSASAYDAVGHRLIAAIAYENLTAKAKISVDKVLGKKGLIYDATWADEIRSDSAYKYSYPWHYQNLNDGMTSQDLQKLLENPTAEGEHLFYAINLMKTRLTKDKNDAQALKFLVHFIADLHQPLHLGREADSGGNKVEISWFGKKTNLHSVWDGSLNESKKMSYLEISQMLQDKFETQKSDFKKYTLLQSIEAGYKVRNLIYNYNLSDTNSYHYIYFFAPKIDEMMYRGGIQLANFINEIYK